MGRNSATIKYGISSLLGNSFNLYLFGSGILTFLQFILGAARTRDIEQGLRIALDYYVAKLTPFPWNEFLTASGFREVLFNISLALCIGVVVASYRYRKNRY